MKETTLNFGNVQVTVIDPENPDFHERLEKAVKEFFRDIERERNKKHDKHSNN